MDYRDFEFWNKEKLWELRKEICLNSMYSDDFENSFGIPKDICGNFFDGFIEYCFYFEDENISLQSIFDKYDNADELWNYFYDIEYPFGE